MMLIATITWIVLMKCDVANFYKVNIFYKMVILKIIFQCDVDPYNNVNISNEMVIPTLMWLFTMWCPSIQSCEYLQCNIDSNNIVKFPMSW